jgi:alkanesulfonate monooxygenase SsuD/methylene tetrahydromethanopterin reductase-like flavin-dependent oxidoreductase (luciferase family)
MLATVTGAGGQPGPYELALDPAKSTMDTSRLVARRAEAARIDALFVPDLLVFGAQGTIGAQEPLTFVAALSQLTSKAGLVATVSTSFHHPFNLARMFGTLDHVSNDRAAWNLVTSSIGEQNYGPGDLPSPEQRYARAAETLEIVHKLWDRRAAHRSGRQGRARAFVDRADRSPRRVLLGRGPAEHPAAPAAPTGVHPGRSVRRRHRAGRPVRRDRLHRAGDPRGRAPTTASTTSSSTAYCTSYASEE